MMNRQAYNQGYRKLHTLLGLIERAEGESSFSNTAKNAVTMLRGFLELLIEHYDELEESVYEDFHAALARYVGPMLKHVLPMNTADVPWSLIPAFEKVLRTEMGENYGLLLRSDWEYNYAVYTTDLASMMFEIVSIFLPQYRADFDEKIAHFNIHVFNFPAVEKNNAVLNTVLGHEIGHFFHAQWQAAEDAGQRILEEAKSELWHAYSGSEGEDLFKPWEKTQEGLRVLKGLYREIISDAVGCMLFGPSMVYSLYYIAAVESDSVTPSEINAYYPPTKYRVRLLMEQFVQGSDELSKLSKETSAAGEALAELHADIEEYLKDESDREALSGYGLEIVFFERTLPEVLQYLYSSIQQKAEVSSNISELYTKIEKGIPINETGGKPIGLPQIIFVSWLHYFRLFQCTDKAEFLDRYKRLMRLTFKSIYSGYVHEEFLNAQKVDHRDTIRKTT